MDDAVLILERGQTPGLVEKFLLAEAEIFARLSGKDRQAALAGLPCGVFAGKILLDGDLVLQKRVPRQICHAEAAVAECAADDIPLL